MATTRRQRLLDPGVTVLRRVPYDSYVQIVTAEENWHLRMTYYDGTLEIMAPRPIMHERPSRRLGLIVLAVASVLELPGTGTGSATFRRKGEGVYKGKGKEPDQSFYVAHEADLLAKGEEGDLDLDAGDPPPDLWIEVDNRGSSKGRLPVYAELGVPEVWRYRTRSKRLVFVRLNEAKVYEPIERSLAYPFLTPALVLEALRMGDGVSEPAWDRALRAWVRDRLGPLARPGV